ncbi:hypothetical protein MKW92_013358 [Papaver armeniacum]|nr:hypothetical protein MKW92_020731 [Papaver armeniacum]KAI3952876.1 hypothetical protein MKW92_013358 [Papaver armeniacum]
MEAGSGDNELDFEKLNQSFSALTVEADSADNERLDFEKMVHGCEHYRRRCRIRAPCCNEIYHCRHCHNEATSLLSNPKDRHELVRRDVTQVICAVCDTEQEVAHVCSNCGVKMGQYFCQICKFYDDDTEKGQFHCDECGICRVGGRDNFFHCKKCGSCYAIGLRDNHLCVENAMRNHCPICYEYLFDSLKDTQVMKCGHTIHQTCYNEMFAHNRYSCPVCSKSTMDLSNVWQRLDQEIEEVAMPEEYRDTKVWILCNDCNDTTEAAFHIFGHKCGHCKSYNTRKISPPGGPKKNVSTSS